MSRKQKEPDAKPSKAYLVSFGDTMTALLAFFIVLNSFAQEQTGANMYSGTGSFMNASNSIGLPGGLMGTRSRYMEQRKSPSPIYAVESEKKDSEDHLGPDEEIDQQAIIDRQTDDFKRFLSEMRDRFPVTEEPPTKSQIVLDSFEQFNRSENDEVVPPLGDNAMMVAAQAMMRLGRDDFKLEIVVWANMPSHKALLKATDVAFRIEEQMAGNFALTEEQLGRLRFSAKPWLFSDSPRPKVSFVISVIEQ